MSEKCYFNMLRIWKINLPSQMSSWAHRTVVWVNLPVHFTRGVGAAHISLRINTTASKHYKKWECHKCTGDLCIGSQGIMPNKSFLWLTNGLDHKKYFLKQRATHSWNATMSPLPSHSTLKSPICSWDCILKMFLGSCLLRAHLLLPA